MFWYISLLSSFLFCYIILIYLQWGGTIISFTNNVSLICFYGVFVGHIFVRKVETFSPPFIKLLIWRQRWSLFTGKIEFLLLLSTSEWKMPKLFKKKNQWIQTSKSTEPGSQTVSQNSFSKLWKQSAHPLSAPLIKTRMLTRMNWSQPNGIYVRSVGQLEAPDLNNLPKMPQ